MSGSDWFSRLEQQLEQQLDSFLRANPDQEELLRQQERRERMRRLGRRRQDLQASAEQIRSELLQLAAEIGAWQQRVERARSAGAGDLAERAERHLAELRGRGRDRWQALGELGVSFRRLEAELNAPAEPMEEPGAGERGGPQVDLDQAWADFEAQQELERLRRQRS